MNWKLIFLLSFFGLGMGVATTYVVPTKAEALVWLPIFIISAWAIAKKCEGRFFLNGFVLGIVDTVWNTGTHIYLYHPYLAHHAREAELMVKAGAAASETAKLFMIAVGIVSAIVSGILLGSFSLVGGKVTAGR